MLTIIEELMSKRQEEFLDHFARLGVFSKVQSLMGSNSEVESDVIKSQEDASSSKSQKGLLTSFERCLLMTNKAKFPEVQPSSSSEPQEDAKEILPSKAYHWHEWSICRGRDCLYIWSDSAALELSNGSNGWFRFILDGKLATMYSSGSPENGNDSSGESSEETFNVWESFMLTSELF